MLSTNRHERQSVHPWYMRRPPLVSASLRETRFLCLSHYLERETKSCRMDNATKCCNNTRRSLPASPDTIRYYLYTFHPPPDRPTDQRTASRCPKRKSPRSDIIIIHIAITQKTTARSTNCISTYLTFLRLTRETYPTFPDLTSPHLSWIPPKKKTSSLIHPSIREDRSHRHQLSYDIQVNEIQLLSESSSYYLR